MEKDSSTVTAEDLEAVKLYCKHLASQWWEHSQEESAVCDHCNGVVNRGEGSIFGSALVCDDCCDDSFKQYGLTCLQKDPNFYGRGALQAAREFILKNRMA